MYRIGLLLFDDVDLLDVGGPYEVLLTANRLAGRRGDDAPFEVVTVADGDRSITAYGGLGLVGSHRPGEALPLDVVVVPGAVDLDGVLARPELLDTVKDLADGAALTTSVCTGALLLARAGLLDGIAATTHHEDVDALAELVGDLVTTARWVDAGPVVTAGGLSSGIAMALHLVERLASRELAVATAAQIEYDWDPEDGVVTT